MDKFASFENLLITVEHELRKNEYICNRNKKMIFTALRGMYDKRFNMEVINTHTGESFNGCVEYLNWKGMYLPHKANSQEYKFALEYDDMDKIGGEFLVIEITKERNIAKNHRVKLFILKELDF